MPRAYNAETEIEYEAFGSSDAPAVLLIMGYTSQMISWDVSFCELLASRGHFVVRFDNRDCGLSTKTDGPAPNVIGMLMKAMQGLEITEEVPYTLSDMANDGLAVLDDLGIARAHIVGASMGGMIAQQMAIDHPERVLSLTSIMSSTGATGVGQPTPTARATLFTPPPPTRDAVIDWAVGVGRAISGPLFDPEVARRRAAASFDRCFHPAGAAFQMAAIAKTGDRTDRLKDLDVPTLVLHGKLDPLIQPSGAEATAAAIPESRLLILDEMGHDLPEPLWPTITEAIATVASAN